MIFNYNNSQANTELKTPTNPTDNVLKDNIFKGTFSEQRKN